MIIYRAAHGAERLFSLVCWVYGSIFHTTLLQKLHVLTWYVASWITLNLVFIPSFFFYSLHVNFFFLTFPACFSIPIIFSNLNSYCSNLSYLRNLQEQVKKAFCYQKLFWPFTVWINCTSDLKNSAKSQPSASNFKSCSH